MTEIAHTDEGKKDNQVKANEGGKLCPLRSIPGGTWLMGKRPKPLDHPDTTTETSKVEGVKDHLVTAAVVKARGEGCPVSGGRGGERGESPGGCPVRGKGKYKADKQYDVYGREVNADNNMPKTAAQGKIPGQKIDLSTERVKSNIRKGGTEDDTWTYPSLQMFWNALNRKGKAQGAEEEDMKIVVAIHNSMNEGTWKKILSWESISEGKNWDRGNEWDEQYGTEPKLLRFEGRPYDLSPLAKLRSFIGLPLPFDRHDWYVDTGGRLRRYVIDYYSDERQAGKDTAPRNLGDIDALKSIIVDVRPAADDVGSIFLRCFKMPTFVRFGMTDFKPTRFFLNYSVRDVLLALPQGLSSTVLNPHARSEEERSLRLQTLLQQAKAQCSQYMETLRSCKGSEECGKASIAFTYCMASLCCKDEAQAFDKTPSLEGVEAMQACLEGVARDAGYKEEA